MRCDVPGCTSTTPSKLLFASPKGAIRPFWTKFLKNCGYLSVSKDRKYQICEMHFHESCFKRYLDGGSRTLFKGAFPTIITGQLVCDVQAAGARVVTPNNEVIRIKRFNDPATAKKSVAFVDGKLIIKEQVTATKIIPSREAIKIQRFNHPDTMKGRIRASFDVSLLEVLSFHEIGCYEIVKLSKSPKFTKPSHVRDIEELYTQLLAICDASKVKFEKIRTAIAKRQNDLRTVIAEKILASSGQSSEHQNLEENQSTSQLEPEEQQTIVIKHEIATIEVPSSDEEEEKCEIPEELDESFHIARKETADLFIGNVTSLADPAAEEGILYEEVECETLEETEMFADHVPSLTDNTVAEEMEYEEVAMDLASVQDFEVVQGFTIETLEPIVELEGDRPLCTSRLTDFESEIPKTKLSRLEAQIQELQDLHQSCIPSSLQTDSKQTSGPIRGTLTDSEDLQRRSRRKKRKLSPKDSES